MNLMKSGLSNTMQKVKNSSITGPLLLSSVFEVLFVAGDFVSAPSVGRNVHRELIYIAVR